MLQADHFLCAVYALMKMCDDRVYTAGRSMCLRSKKIAATKNMNNRGNANGSDCWLPYDKVDVIGIFVVFVNAACFLISVV